jgi:hypothetical protein
MKNVRSNRFSGPGAAEAATTNVFHRSSTVSAETTSTMKITAIGYRLFSQEFDSLGRDDTNNENYSYRLAAIGYRLFSEEVSS